MNTMDQIAAKIISEQAFVIGPLAWSEAGKVSGLRIVDQTKGEVHIEDADPKEVINRLVSQYERMFGRASHETCREAVLNIIAELTPSEIPSSLASV